MKPCGLVDQVGTGSSVLRALAQRQRDVLGFDPHQDAGREQVPHGYDVLVGVLHRTNDTDADARVLEDAVLVMRARQATLRGVTRLHTPTVAEPLMVVVIDELAGRESAIGGQLQPRLALLD